MDIVYVMIKIVMIVLCLGSIALFTGGVVGYQQYNERNFYSEKYVAFVSQL